MEDTRFPDEFVTWNHQTPVGVKVAEVFGMDSKTGRVWMEMAKQIYAEEGEPNYRVIEHFENGAPYLEGLNYRISLTHTTHFLAVASLPKTPEINLAEYNPRTAMGIDAEPLNRQQVIKVRNKFLSENEENIVDSENLESNIIAWTSKEALYKAGFYPGLDFRNDIELITLPEMMKAEGRGHIVLGKAILNFPKESGRSAQEMILYSYENYGCCVTIALSTKCAIFGKKIK